MATYFSTFRQEGDSSVETIEIHSNPEDKLKGQTFVLIKEEDTFKPVLNLKLTPNFSLPFRETQIINDNVLIGWSESFAIFNLKTRKHSVISVDGYFGNFRIYNNLIFVCSAFDVTCISFEGDIKWKSESLAVDGVVINSFDSNTVYCSCECNPPGGWMLCELDILTGITSKNFS